MKRWHFCSVLLILGITAASLSASAQSLNKNALRQQLLHKVFLLRGRYVCPTPKPCNLSFNLQGQLQSAAAVGPLSRSAIYVNSVQFNRHTLTLNAQEATLLRLSAANPPLIKALVLSHQQLRVRIAIEETQTPKLQHALQTIFAGDIHLFLNDEPQGERRADLESLPLLTPITKTKAGLQLTEVGWPGIQTLDIRRTNGVKAPKPLYMMAPSYTSQARRDRVQGTCMLYLVVNTDGFPQNIRILKTLPDGLDERALAAVSQYRFRPAMQNGKAVPVKMIVEVDFHLW